MRSSLILVILFFLKCGYAVPARNVQYVLQAHSGDETASKVAASRKLNGRFLHITDLHPDPFYKIHSSTEEERVCHRGSGAAGTYGAETSDCDSPFSLINETFRWIENNLRDKVDFVVWTGDSARHDSDEKLPRNADQVLGLNKYIAGKFAEVFGNGKDEGDTGHEMVIPVIPTFGNNDILPHNILMAGPNKWLQRYADIWQKFIPEEQRHGFQRGGWFWVEVIPQKLAVFSLNTLYFFDHNAAVDGCSQKSEPGWEHMEWLRIQLQFMRERGMKAILVGHVPPARTESKQLWDETCWQKYTLWLKQYRDVVLGGIFGHMNIDHFFLQDTKEVDLQLIADVDVGMYRREHLDDELSIESAADYLEELRDGWSKLPNPSFTIDESLIDSGTEEDLDTWKKKKEKKDKDLKKIGGPWGERYQLSTISPSVVPNFYPTLRVMEYNITGLEEAPTWSWGSPAVDDIPVMEWMIDDFTRSEENCHEVNSAANVENDTSISKKKKKHKKPKKGKPKDPNLNVPPPPSKSSPPGPAYSPQTLTLLGYTQYFANLTYINNDLMHSSIPEDIDTDGWHGGKHKDKKPKDKKPHPREFAYEVEYSTFNDSKFKLQDMTVRSYLTLAHRIGQYKPAKGDQIEGDDDHNIITNEESDEVDEEEQTCIKNEELWQPSTLSNLVDDLLATIQHYTDLVNAWLASSFLEEYLTARPQVDQEDEAIHATKSHKGGHKKKKGHKRRNKNKSWLAFIKRAFVGTLDDDEVKNFVHVRDVEVNA